MPGEIYLIISPSKKMYIGQAVSNLSCGKIWGTKGRWKNHVLKALPVNDDGKARCRALDAAIRKYGHESFEVYPILYVIDEKNLDYYESIMIKEYNTLTPYGYNLTEGGGSGKWSDESRLRFSEKMKEIAGHSQTQETRDKISKTLKETQGTIISNRNKLKKGIPQKKQSRKHPEDNDLPKYIAAKRSDGVLIGYTVCGVPGHKTKTFKSTKNKPQENLDKALIFLQSLYSNNQKSSETK